MAFRTLPAPVAAFVHEHLATEQGHLAFFDRLLLPSEKSLATPVWAMAGYALGFFPTLAGAHALYCTIHAVETYVELHYNAHIHPLEARQPSNPYPALTSALKQFCSDEVAHAQDAADRYGFQRLHRDLGDHSLARLWSWVVAKGSAAAVAVAKRL
jgi:ubiquinone biosynthesis monooxygenase Coq7